MEIQNKSSPQENYEMSNGAQNTAVPEITTSMDETPFESDKGTKSNEPTTQASTSAKDGDSTESEVHLPDQNGKEPLLDPETKAHPNLRKRVSAQRKVSSSSEDDDNDGVIQVDKIVVVDDRREHKQPEEKPPEQEAQESDDDDVDLDYLPNNRRVPDWIQDQMRELPNYDDNNKGLYLTMVVIAVLVFISATVYLVGWNVSAHKREELEKAVDI